MTLGCGGSDSGGTPSPARFAGHYVGAWTSSDGPNQPVSGTLDVRIDQTGAVAGDATDSEFGSGTLVDSYILGNGSTGFRVGFPNPQVGTVTTFASGRLVLDASGNLAGTLRRDLGDIDADAQYTLTRQAD